MIKRPFAYSTYPETKKILETTQKNIIYLYYHYNKKYGATVYKFAETLSSFGNKNTIERQLLEKVIYDNKWDITVKVQGWNIILWCAVADYAKISLKELMFEDIELLDQIRGVVR